MFKYSKKKIVFFLKKKIFYIFSFISHILKKNKSSYKLSTSL